MEQVYRKDRRRTTVEYEIRNADGHLVAIHEHVKNPKTGDKQCYWKQPNGESGLNGTSRDDLPLYGVHELNPDATLVVVTEGEKARDFLKEALADDRTSVVGTVTGAGGTPSPATLEALQGYEVTLWQDADGPGSAHMARIAERLQRIAAMVRIYDWHDAPEKGDAADHPAVISGNEKALDRLLNDLCGAPEYVPPEPEPKPTSGKAEGYRAGLGFPLTDLGNAERLAAQHGEDLRYVHAGNDWLSWTGKRWQVDDTGEINRRAKNTVRAIYGEAEAATDSSVRRELASHAMKSEAESRLRALISLTQSEEGIPVRVEDLDRNPWLLNVQNGTLNLKTGKLREHRREDLMTKIAPVEYEPDAKAPTWEAFLERILPSEELRQFVQRLIGYSLTGDVSAQVLPFFYGAGANGKSTLINTFLTVLGDYGQQAAPELLLSKRGAHPTELADLKGARLVASVEVEDGRRMAESLVKQLTGGERIKARYLHRDFFEFAPTHKLFLAANHKPEVQGTDHAIWRRVKLIPFEVTIPDEEQDPHFSEKLQAELPGILSWAVRGCLDWQSEGLGEPEKVKDATQEYRAENDVLADFMRESCVIAPNVWCVFADLYGSYERWCEESGEQAESKRKFSARLRERGYPPDNGTDNVSIRRGIALRDDRKPDGSGSPGINEHPSEKPPREDSKATGDNGINERIQNINPENPCKSQENGEAINHHYPENENSGSNSFMREVSEKSLMPVNSLIPEPDSEQKKIDNLVSGGMSPELARAEVLGDEVGVI